MTQPSRKHDAEAESVLQGIREIGHGLKDLAAAIRGAPLAKDGGPAVQALAKSIEEMPARIAQETNAAKHMLDTGLGIGAVGGLIVGVMVTVLFKRKG